MFQRNRLEIQPKLNPEDEVMQFMALTFGTLLSSQGADAHHLKPFDLIRGNQ
jgi:hypothetical protein